jgi:hypothetical protein
MIRLAAAALLLALGAGCSPAGPDTPVAAPPGAEPGPVEPGQPERVEPVPAAANPRPHAFESVVALGERELGVRFWNGIPPCYVLARVDVREGPDQVVVTLFTGSDPLAGAVACIDVARYYEVAVGLAEPLGTRAVVDGAA